MLALLAGACSHADPMAGETACQKRMVAIPSAPDISPPARPLKELPAAFETMSRRYAAMDLDGCTDDQRGQIAALVRHTHTIATLAARAAQPGGAQKDPLASQAAVLQFESEIRGFENRRLVMQRDLERMESVRLR